MRYACLTLLLLLLTACGGQESPEDQIRERIREGELAAEAREKVALASMISGDYEDARGRTAKELRRIAIGFLMRYQQIQLLARVRSVTMASESEGTAVVLMAMLSQQEADQLPLPLIRADLYRFELTYRDEGGEWYLVNSTWERASPQDLIE